MRRGVRAVFVEARVAILVWLTNVALALVAAPAVWSWWARTSLLPEADPLLERFHTGIFRDLLIDGGFPLSCASEKRRHLFHDGFANCACSTTCNLNAARPRADWPSEIRA